MLNGCVAGDTIVVRNGIAISPGDAVVNWPTGLHDLPLAIFYRDLVSADGEHHDTKQLVESQHHD